jgi:FkbM family methyltransferase
VHFYPFALAAEDKTSDLDIHKENYGHSLRRGPDHDGQTEKVVCKSLPTVLKEVGVDHIDLLKLDIEREEYELLFTLPPEIYRKIENIVLEIHDSPKKEELLKHVFRWRRTP